MIQKLFSNPKNFDRLQLIALMVIVFLAMNNVIFLGIIWDDNDSVFQNPNVIYSSWESVRNIFTTKVLSVYVPLTTFSFFGEYAIFGNTLYFYHLNNLLLHVTIVALIFYLGKTLGFSSMSAFLGALLFGVHPVHVESVAWISERKDVLYSFFYVLALIAHNRFMENKKISYLAATYGLGFLSVLSKPMALSLPLALFLLDWFQGRKLNKISVAQKFGHFVYIIPIALVTYIGHARNPIVDFGQAVLLWLWSLSFYIEKFFWPVSLTALYEPAVPVTLTNPQYIKALAIVALSGVILFLYRKNKFIVFAFAYYFVSIFFLLRMDLEHDLTFVADRYMYLPSLGFCLLAGIFIERIMKMTKQSAFAGMAVKALVVGLFITLIILSSHRTYIYSDLSTMWQKTLAKNPHLSFAHYSLANFYTDIREYDKALAHYNASLAIRPYSPEVYNFRGRCYADLKKYDLALADYNRSIELSKDYFEPYFNRGVVYLENNLLHLALADFNKTLEINPQYILGYNNRANANIRLKNYEAAIEDLNEIIRLNKRFLKAYFQLAYISKQMQNWDQALLQYDKILSLRPKNPYALNRRGEVLMRLNRYEEALADFNRAIELFPQFGLAFKNRAVIHEKLELKEEFENDQAKAAQWGDEVDYEEINAF